MICGDCRNKRHKFCLNNYSGKDPIVQRPEPINACACQHKESWNFVTTKDINGDSTES